MMDISEALEVLEDARLDAGMDLLEFLQYMSESDLDSFTNKQAAAYRIAMRDFRKLLMSKEAV